MNKYHKNPRTLTKKQFELLKRDLQELGDLSGVVHDINSDEIISGNQRSEIFDVNSCRIEIIKEYKEPTKTGTVAEGFIYYKDERFSYRKVDWTPEQCEKANIVANKAGGSWDMDTLANMFDFDNLMDWGFSDKELIGLDFGTDTKGLTEDDTLPEDVETICKRGDLWRLGEHRLLCGNATKEEDVKRLMGGENADMVFTDPPYSVGIGDKNKSLQSVQKAGLITEDIKNDNLSVEETAKTVWSPAFSLINEILNDGGSYYITAPQGGDQMMMMMMMKESIPCKHELIWLKNQPNFSLGRLDYDYKHEPILYGWKGAHTFIGQGEFKKSIWEIDRVRKCDLHPTMKPVELIINSILNSSKKNYKVYDSFLGSGTTLIACEKTNRKCYGMEIDEHYCDVIIQRWQDFTGKKAKKL